MFKKIILTGFFIGCSLISIGQTNHGESSTRNTITDNAIVFPADMEQNYDQLLTKWRQKIKFSDNCRSNSDSPVTFEDSVYIRRLYALPTKMELVFNPIVRNYIEMYAGRRRNQVSYMLGEGKRYFSIFEEALDREGLPLELKYLPVIESALNPIARSRVGATGLWQFMAGTGKMYNLEINSLVDERCDPTRSTEAAAKYLKDLFSIYGDWNLVIAAYNCGPGNVNKAIRRSGGQTDYWAIYPHLPRETRGYVPAFIAATYIMSYHNDHNICPVEFNNPTVTDSLVINRNIHFQQIADVINVSVEDLRQLNPQFKNDMIPGEYKGYALRLPINKVSAFIDNKETIYTHKFEEYMPHRKVAGADYASASSSTSTKIITHKVKKGDTLAKLARTYGVSSNQIKKWNKLASNKLSAGKRLKIHREVPQKKQSQSSEPVLASNNDNSSANTPRSNSATVSGGTTTKTEAKTVTSYYKVRKGDTWPKIAKKNGATIAQIKKWNNIKSNKLMAGKQLKIQKTEYVQIQVEEEIVQNKLSEPVLPSVDMDSTFTASLFDTYLKKVETERDGSVLPRVRIASNVYKNSKESSTDSRIIYHKVKIGETINQIASRYNVSKKEIMSWNKLPSGGAKVGQRLLIILPESKVGAELKSDNRQQSHRQGQEILTASN